MFEFLCCNQIRCSLYQDKSDITENIPMSPKNSPRSDITEFFGVSPKIFGVYQKISPRSDNSENSPPVLFFEMI